MLERNGLLNAPQRSSPFILTLPLPPSVNRFTAKLGNKSPAVQKWVKQADGLVISLKPLPSTVKGPFSLHIIYSEQQFKSFDIDNRIKPLLDYLQRIEIIDNDRNCSSVTVNFGYVPRGFVRVGLHANW